MNANATKMDASFAFNFTPSLRPDLAFTYPLMHIRLHGLYPFERFTGISGLNA